MMTRILVTLSLLLFAFAAIAQDQSTAAKHPCLLPALELYNEKQQKLAEGAIPTGKILMQLQKNDACLEGVKYEVTGMYVALARGFIRKTETTVEGNTIDFSEMESRFVPGDRLVLILKVNYTTEQGKKGKITSFHNWLFKQNPE